MTNPLAANYRAIGPTPLIVWESEFRQFNSPLLPHAKVMHDAAGPHSALCLGMMHLENKYATTGRIIKPGDWNPLSLRPWDNDPLGLPEGAIGVIVASDGGKFLRFSHPKFCVMEWRKRLFDRPDYKGGVYTRVHSLDAMLDTYAPPGDVHPETGVDNADIEYAESVRTMLRHYAAMEGGNPLPTPTEGSSGMGFDIGDRPLRIAIGTGHANSSGGNAFELALNKKVVNAVLRLARESKGFEVRCYTPNDGLGMYPGDLSAAAAVPRSWWSAGWKADILHEVHQEGLGNKNVRGAFVIYPDSRGLSGRKAGGDYVDTDVKVAGGQMGRILAEAYGGVTRYGNPGRAMSETETGVAEDGYRLGVFGAWSDSYLIQNTCQFISEGATYTNPIDLALMKQPDHAEKQARGILKMYAYLAETRGNWTYPYQIGGADSEGPILPNVPRVAIKELAAFLNDPDHTTQLPPLVRMADGSEAIFINAMVRFPVGTKILQYANQGAAELRGPVTQKEHDEGLYVPLMFKADDGQFYGYNAFHSRIPMAGAVIIK